MDDNNNKNNAFYYGDNNYLNSYKNNMNNERKKRKKINIIAILIFLLSIVSLYKTISFSYVALGISVFCLVCSICSISNKDVFYYLAGIFSLASIIIFSLFYLGVINNESAALKELRKTQFVNDIKGMTNRVEEDYHISASIDPKCYNLDKINSLSKKKFTKSPLGGEFSPSSYIKISGGFGSQEYVICVVDSSSNGFNNVSKNTLSKKNLILGTADKCILSKNCK